MVTLIVTPRMQQHVVSFSIILATFYTVHLLTSTQRANKVRRSIIEDGADDEANKPYAIVEEFMEATQNIDGHDNFNDVANMTQDAWIQMQLDLGMGIKDLVPFEVDREDIQPKNDAYPASMMAGLAKGGRKRKKQKQGSIMKFRIKDIPKLHPQMNLVHEYRQGKLLNEFVEDSGIAHAIPQPVETLSRFQRTNLKITPDNTYPDYNGDNKTHPSMQKFLDEFGYDQDATKLFAASKTQIWFLLPGAVPLFGGEDDHIEAYGNYWKFVEKFKTAFDHGSFQAGARRTMLRISIGLWQNGAVFSPRGAIYRAKRFPWVRVSQYYTRPRTTTAMPKIITTAGTLLKWVTRFGASTVSAGTDCYVIWFHQDFAADAADLLDPEKFEQMELLYKQCTVIHMYVGFDKTSPATMAYAAAVNPALQRGYAKDPEFSGSFFFDDLHAIAEPEAFSAVTKYMMITKNRAGCRSTSTGWIAPEIVPMPTGGASLPTGMPNRFNDERTAQANYNDLTLGPNEDGLELATVLPTNFRSLWGPGEDRNLGEKLMEVDSCCGHDMWTAIPFDSELRTCCNNGQVLLWGEEGEDPCEYPENIESE